ncbi:hypothetical protein [Anabaena catenula]|uniref:CpcD n=1 Tax=Anabaena catenula FACHB-362 TaxID=2692877 RepID=A0ABR8J895_9NOST|nr:hypothetical protein [Anabaena catenula]MBD2694435.1 hypothetical protein [Anabaena catenula FACHB-362]
MPIQEVSVSPLPPLNKYVLQDTEDSALAYFEEGGTSYFGYADIEGRWYIERCIYNPTSNRFAAGEGDYATNWANRASLTYDYIYNAL